MGLSFVLGLGCQAVGANASEETTLNFAFFDASSEDALDSDVLGAVETMWDSSLISFDTAPVDVLNLSFMPPLPKGWSASVDVALDEGDEEPAPLNGPAFADGLDAKDPAEMVSGFYTMRYDFESDTAFRPYAGAGIGLVSVGDDTDRRDSLAGRALAGFDVAVDQNAAFFAEYAFMKSGGSAGYSGVAGTSIDLPDDTHSFKIGFRRSF